MPVGRSADFYLGGKPFMLSRAREIKGRAWERTGQPDTPSRRSTTDLKYGDLPSEIEHVEVWDDWSGGYGHAYRDSGMPNTVHWGFNMDTRFPRQMVHCQVPRLMDSLAAIGSFNQGCGGMCEVQGNAYGTVSDVPIGTGQLVFYGRTLQRRIQPLSNTSFYHVSQARNDHNLSGRAAVFGGYAYIPSRSPSSSFLQLDIFTAADVTVTSPMLGRGFCVAGNRLWRHHGTNYLQSCAVGADPTATANWSATLSIGDGAGEIQDLVALNDQLFVGLPDGLYAGDQSGTFYNVLSDLANQRHADNARDLCVYNGGVVVPHVAGLFWYKPSDYLPETREISPLSLRSDRSPVRGRIRAVRPFGSWLYAGLWTGSESYVLAGRDATGAYVWHAMQKMPHPVAISRIHIDGITTSTHGGQQFANRMWVGTDGSIGALTGATSPLYVWPIPMLNDNPLASDPLFSGNYVGSARVDLPSTDWGAPATPKVFRAVEIDADSLLSGVRYADVYYTIDDGTRATLGRAQTSPKSTLYFSSGEGSFVGGHRIALSLESFTASQDISPVYRSVVLRGAIRPRSADLITAVVRIADNMRDRSGAIMRPGAKMLADLRAYAEATAPTRLLDLAGAESWVAVLEPVKEMEVYQEGEKDPEIAASVRMAVQQFE